MIQQGIIKSWLDQIDEFAVSQPTLHSVIEVALTGDLRLLSAGYGDNPDEPGLKRLQQVLSDGVIEVPLHSRHAARSVTLTPRGLQILKSL